MLQHTLLSGVAMGGIEAKILLHTILTQGYPRFCRNVREM